MVLNTVYMYKLVWSFHVVVFTYSWAVGQSCLIRLLCMHLSDKNVSFEKKMTQKLFIRHNLIKRASLISHVSKTTTIWHVITKGSFEKYDVHLLVDNIIAGLVYKTCSRILSSLLLSSHYLSWIQDKSIRRLCSIGFYTAH